LASGSRTITPKPLVQAGLEQPLLSGPVEAVVADLDHARPELASPPGLVEVSAGEGQAKVPDRAPGHLLVQGLPEVVVVEVPSLVYRPNTVFRAARTALVGLTHAVCATTEVVVCGINAKRVEVLNEDWEAACFVKKCPGCIAGVAAST
jgi:hypothetical protein